MLPLEVCGGEKDRDDRRIKREQDELRYSITVDMGCFGVM